MSKCLLSTFLSASVEDGHVLQVDTESTPDGYSVSGVRLEATPDGAIRVGPNTTESRTSQYERLASLSQSSVTLMAVNGVLHLCMLFF